METQPHKQSRATKVVERRFGELLRETGLITLEQLTDGLERQRNGDPRRIGEILVEMGAITEHDRVRVLAGMVGIAFIIPSTDDTAHEAQSKIPPALAEKHNLLPLSIESGCLTVAVEQFTDVYLAEELASACRMPIQVVAATADDIRRTRKLIQRQNSIGTAESSRTSDASLDKILEEIAVDDLQVVEAVDEDSGDLESNATESPIVKLVNYIIKSAVQCGASDIHIEPSESSFRVRYRVDGELVQTVSPPSRLLSAVVSRIKILATMDISERRLPQDGALTVNLHDRAIDLRISTMATKIGEKVVMRIVDRSIGLCTLDDIGMPDTMLARLRRVIREPNGMILVTGPTGSGKSTTLYAALAEIVSQTENISTIEDPIERVIKGLNQFQVHTAAGFSFAGALRAILRQDPDVIMVGEIRDAETAKLATEAALTGHLVFSTLHTNDAPTAVPRLVNMGVEPYLVAASLRGVLAQRLCRRLCPNCKAPRTITPELRHLLDRTAPPDHAIKQAFTGSGCDACAHSGVQGRVGVFDLRVFNELKLSAMLRSQRINPHASQPPESNAGLAIDGADKVNQGLITVESFLKVAPSTQECNDAESSTHRHAA